MCVLRLLLSLLLPVSTHIATDDDVLLMPAGDADSSDIARPRQQDRRNGEFVRTSTATAEEVAPRTLDDTT